MTVHELCRIAWEENPCGMSHASGRMLRDSGGGRRAVGGPTSTRGGGEGQYLGVPRMLFWAGLRASSPSCGERGGVEPARMGLESGKGTTSGRREEPGVGRDAERKPGVEVDAGLCCGGVPGIRRLRGIGPVRMGLFVAAGAGSGGDGGGAAEMSDEMAGRRALRKPCRARYSTTTEMAVTPTHFTISSRTCAWRPPVCGSERGRAIELIAANMTAADGAVARKRWHQK